MSRSVPLLLAYYYKTNNTKHFQVVPVTTVTLYYTHVTCRLVIYMFMAIHRVFCTFMDY